MLTKVLLIVLAVMSSLFDSWFGFIFWGVAYLRMRNADEKAGRKRNRITAAFSTAVNYFIIAMGVFFLSAGTYASVQSIIDAYASGSVGGVFSCASNGL